MRQTDIQSNHTLCLHCQHISSTDEQTCYTCGETLHQRKPDSFNRTLYLTLAALVFYFPSNYFTIMKTKTLTTYEDNTIMEGIFYFFAHGEYFVGTVIFMASVFIPMVKLVILIFLLHSIKTGSSWKLRDKKNLFVTIHTIGRWSMLDIFVMGLMLSMVHFEGLAMVTLGWASLSFAIMVVLTMFATQSFDTRLLWDKLNN